MKKSLAMRLLAVVLCVAMLAAVTPIFAAAEIEIDEIVITDADLTPVIGEKAGDYLAYTLSDDAPYTCTSHYWYNDTKGVSLKSDDTFVEGDSYSLFWGISPKDGYVFLPSATISVNDGEGRVDYAGIADYDCGIWMTTTTAVAPPSVAEICVADADITPVVGEKAGDHLAYTLFGDAVYDCTEQYWYNVTQEVALGDDDVFNTEDLYALKWTFVPAAGFIFTDGMTILLNGGEEAIDEAYTTITRNECVLRTTAVKAKMPPIVTNICITDADLTPVIGEKAGDFLAYTLPDDAAYTCTEHYWYNVTKEVALGSDDVFNTEDLYALKWTFAPAEGYTFAGDATVSLNGSEEAVDAERTTIAEDECVLWTTAIEAEDPSMITEICITDADVTPAAGERVGDHLAYTLPDDAPYICTEQYWYSETKETVMGEDDCFVKGDSYVLKWTFVPAEKCVFAEDVTFSINGNDGKVEYDNTTVAAKKCVLWSVSLTSLDMSKAIREVNLIFSDSPEVGKKASDYWDFAVPDDAPYYCGAVNWVNRSNGRDMWEDDIFYAGETYNTWWILWTEDDYFFAEDVKVLVNGREGQILEDSSWIGGGQGNLCTVPIEMPPAIMISEIELTDMDITPVLGKKGSEWLHITLPENCGYTICEHVWHNATTWYHMNPDEVFVDDDEYFVYITFATLPEYAFSEDVKVTINGSADPVDTDHSGCEGPHNFVIWTKRATTPPPTEISEINLTDVDITPLASHRVGSLLHATLPEDCGYTIEEHVWNGEGVGNLENDQVFVEGNTYRTIIKLKAKPGYIFGGDIVATVNGSADQIDTAHGGRYSDDTFSIWLKPQKAQFVFDLESGIHLMVGKTWVNKTNAADVLGDGHASYDDKTKTLTLKYLTVVGCSYVEDVKAYCSIYADQFLTIRLEGSNMLHPGIETFDRSCYGIYVQGEGECPPLLTGDGNLAVYAGDTESGDSVAIYESTDEVEIAATGSLIFQTGVCGIKGESNPISCRGGVLFSGFDGKNELSLVSGNVFNIRCAFPCEVKAMLFTDFEKPATEAPDDCFEKDGELIRFHTDKSYAEIDFSFRNEIIDTIELNGFAYAILNGKVSEYPGFTVPEGAPYHFEADGAYWMNDTDKAELDADDTFEKGKSYSIGGCLVADEGYAFDENAVILINGGKYTPDKDRTKIDGFDDCRFSVWSKSRKAVLGVVDTVEIAGFCVPVIGDRVGDSIHLTVPEGVHYRLAEGESCWYDYSDMSVVDADATFKADTLYALGGTLIADEGYIFVDNPTIRLNGDFALDQEYTYLDGFDERNFYISGQPKEALQTQITDPTEPSGETVLGDANYDGAVNMKDVLTLRKMLASIEVAYNAQNSDVNLDGEVNMKDVLMLRKFLAGLIEKLGA